MKRVWSVLVLEMVTGLVGFALLWMAQGWLTAIAVFFIIWSHNVGLKTRI